MSLSRCLRICQICLPLSFSTAQIWRVPAALKKGVFYWQVAQTLKIVARAVDKGVENCGERVRTGEKPRMSLWGFNIMALWLNPIYGRPHYDQSVYSKRA